jgi:radical SAM protein with 4Fe4S-binding SPASM domain
MKNNAPRLQSITLMVTDRCDQSCSFCYAKYKPDSELSLAEIEGVLDQAAAMGAIWLIITGGDPYRRKDLHGILELAHQRRFATTIKTHGMHIDEDEAHWLAQRGVRRVDLSVHGDDAAQHDAVTRVPGSYKRTMAAAQALKAEKVRVNMSMVVTRHNVESMPQTLDKLAEDYGVTVGFSMGRTLLGSKAPQEDQATGDALVRARMAVLRHGPRSGCSPEGYEDPADDDVPCQAGRRIVTVLPEGNVTPCVVYPRILGNIRANSLAEIWTSHEALTLRQETYSDHSECGGCSAKKYCKFCPGHSYIERGDATKATPRHCVPAFALKEAVRRTDEEFKVASLVEHK